MSNSLKAPRSDNRLPLILDVAAKLFREKGYAATSMRDIAAAVGMLPGSIYYHFPAKEDLLVAVYADGVRMISDSVRARPRVGSGASRRRSHREAEVSSRPSTTTSRSAA